MSTSDEEKDQIINDVANELHIDILLTGYMTKDEVIAKLITLLEEWGH